jgi:murein DD-endopeptidase MepM/ murein hydrolase activator NlpD
VARKLFYTGFTVILDHGFGLFTIYGHMSKLKTKEGAILKKGEIMGLSGMTGRASGPHLHWGVNLHGTKVDPRVLSQVLNTMGDK